MANFDVAFDRAMKHEGFPGYVNDPDDHGGETVAGISRKNWPGASVWPLVDAAKKRPNFPANLAAVKELLPAVKDFYRRNFWNPALDQVESQDVANWIFDKWLNTGSFRRVVKWVQGSIGAAADGIIGPATLRAIREADPAKVLSGAKEQARAYYLALVEEDPTQKKFLKGWLARV